MDEDKDQPTFVSALLKLSVMTGLLHEVQDVLGEALIGQGPSCQSEVVSISSSAIRNHEDFPLTSIRFSRHNFEIIEDVRSTRG